VSHVSAEAGRQQPIAREPADRRALAVMTTAHGIQHLYVAGLAVSYPFVVAQFHVSYAVLGAVLTVSGVLGGVLQGSAGLARRASTAVMLVGQNAGMACASLLGAIAPGFGVFSGARILGSVTSWPQHPVGSAYLARRFPHRRASVLSWHVAGGSAGTVVAPLMVSALIGVAGWRWALVALGAALAAGGLLVRLALPPEAATAPPGKDAPAGDTAPADGAAQSPAPPARLRELLRRPEVAAVLAASSIAAGGRGLGTLTTYIPAYLRSGLHMPALTVGVLFTVVMAAGIAGPLAAGSLADRFGRARTLVLTYLAGAVALAWFGFAGHDLAALVILGICVGVFAYAESPLLQSVFSDLAEHAAGGREGRGGQADDGQADRGRARSAFGAYFAIAYGVGALWNAVIGWIVTAAGFGTAFAVMAASFAASAAVIAAFARDRRHEPA
jgi:MFS family permease